ncbi:hypothetical protein NUM_47600 [Actinocatenispora comari]|uniref:DUF2637 domain-containing protein n=2 Tax=Actinocatenispora comari TaxID=2807577 RepID=A0A8J4ADW9_9ACTN|nr:hypothetical protein NUM_47600 [Actinocatenispora comari]
MESAARLVIMGVIGVMAGAASFTHMHDWTMQNAPHGTPEWFGWANAVVSELTPALALLEWRRRRRAGGSIGYPVALLVGSGLLSLAAQVSQANASLSSKALAALPAIAFTLLIKLVFSSLPGNVHAPRTATAEHLTDHDETDATAHHDHHMARVSPDAADLDQAPQRTANHGDQPSAPAHDQEVPATVGGPTPVARLLPPSPPAERHDETVSAANTDHIGDSAAPATARPLAARVVAPARPVVRVNSSAREVPSV